MRSELVKVFRSKKFSNRFHPISDPFSLKSVREVKRESDTNYSYSFYSVKEKNQRKKQKEEEGEDCHFSVVFVPSAI